MNIIERIDKIFKANVNAILDKAEDPAKMIDETLRELYEDLAEVKEHTAAVMADEKAALRDKQDCELAIAEADNAARNALASGHEDDARKILEKKQQLNSSLTVLEQRYEMAKANSKKMRDAHDKLVNDIQDLNSRKEFIKAKIKTAEAQEKINSMSKGSTVDTSASIEAFERWEAKADKMLDVAMAKAELAEDAGVDTPEDLVKKYSKGSTVEIDAEIAKMKEEMGL